MVTPTLDSGRCDEFLRTTVGAADVLMVAKNSSGLGKSRTHPRVNGNRNLTSCRPRRGQNSCAADKTIGRTHDSLISSTDWYLLRMR
jgi:hypothetical protein